ncbi:MAG: flagellar protein FlgN [Limnobacter sp.]|nr:flagellar protein FlgN [Limnobacter sp.]
MPHTITPKTLYKELAQECELAMQLVDVLLEEQSSLIRMETQRLSDLALKKEGLMFELEKRFQSNSKLAVQAGYAEDLVGLNAWISSLADGIPELTSTFQTLKSSLEQAQRLNIINGELVTEQLAGIQERISILTAASVQTGTGGAHDTYGPKGGMSPGSGLKPRAVIR